MRRTHLLLLAVFAASACADSVINEIGPDNNQTVSATADSFTYIATNLENVSDKEEFTWVNSEPRAMVNHLSFLPHGYGLLIIRDGVGTVVDSTLLEWELLTESRRGVPGTWSVTLIYTGAFGRSQFTLSPMADGEELPEEARMGRGAPPR